MRSLFFTFAVLSTCLVVSAQAQHPDKALCSVCALKGGETNPEKVRAHSEYEGKFYYFCADHCKAEFDSDPVAFLPPVLPRPAPDFKVEKLTGEVVSLQDYKDKFVLVDFWATWCKPCLETMPALQKFYSQNSDKDFVVMGVSLDEGKDRIKKIQKFADKMDISYPIFSDAQPIPAWHQFKVKAIPALFLINPEGQVVAQWTGKVDDKKLTAELQQWLEKPATAAGE